MKNDLVADDHRFHCAHDMEDSGVIDTMDKRKFISPEVVGALFYYVVGIFVGYWIFG